MKDTNKILLRRKNKLIVEKNGGHVQDRTEKAVLISMVKNFESLGFTISAELFEVLGTYTKIQLDQFYKSVISCLKEMIGADKVYKPMYPNFPEQVMNTTNVELYLNAILHYFTFGQWMPEYEKNERLPLFDDNKNIILSIGTIEDLMGIFTNLVASKTSLSEQDKEDMQIIMLECNNYYKYLPEEIPLKENVAFISKLIIEKDPLASEKTIGRYFKTATDVLRLIVALSDGDISLAKRTRYRSLRRKERRIILALLSDCGDITEDLFRYEKEWRYACRFLHPFEESFNKSKYENSRKFLYVLHNKKKPLMFAGKVQDAIVAKDMRTAATLLKNRPGDFARQLDKLLRDADDKNYVVNCFKDVAKDVSTPVLLQVYQHFVGRAADTKLPVRVCFPKGNLAQAMVIGNDVPDIDVNICKAIQCICKDAIVENYKSREYMGNVYIDPTFKDYLVPFSQRSASKTVKSIVRGSRVAIKKDATAVRAFIWWTNTKNGNTYYDDERVDIDLSAAMFDENWGYIDHVSYNNLRSGKMEAYHSGDIVDGGSVNGDGVAEFLDINIKAIAKRCRYVVYQVYAYTNQKYSELPNVRFGWMEREDVHSGEIFEPKTVTMSMDLTAESTVAIPVIFDCVERKFIWCDMNLSLNSVSRRYGGNNLESNLEGTTATCFGMSHLNKANLYDLIMFNTLARGKIVDDRNNADIIFSNDTSKPVEPIYELHGSKMKKFIYKERQDVPIYTMFDLDYYMGQMI